MNYTLTITASTLEELGNVIACLKRTDDTLRETPVNRETPVKIEKYRLWTDEEDAIIVDKLGKMPIQKLAKKLGRTNAKVYNRIYTLRKQGKLQARNYVKRGNTVRFSSDGIHINK